MQIVILLIVQSPRTISLTYSPEKNTHSSSLFLLSYIRLLMFCTVHSLPVHSCVTDVYKKV